MSALGDRYQLTYTTRQALEEGPSASGSALERQLRRRSLLEFTALPAPVGEQLPGCGRALFVLDHLVKHSVLVVIPEATGQKQEKLVAPGESFEVGGYFFRYTLAHADVGRSATSRFLNFFAHLLAVLLFALQLWVMLGLPSLVTRSGVWKNSLVKLKIVEKLDSLRVKLGKQQTKNPLAQIILMELSEEVAARTRHMKMFDDTMGRSQRNKMYEECLRLERIVDGMAQMEQFSELPPLPLEKAVERILSRWKVTEKEEKATGK